jgi:Domain of unknown function (DUF4168)
MSVHNRLLALKKLSALMGVAGASVLISFPAWSQSAPADTTSGETPTQIAQDSSPSSGSEIELSPEGLEILCERFPLNSRCGGGTAGSGELTPRSNPGSLDSNPSLNDPASPGSDQIPPGETIDPGSSTTPPYTRPDGGQTQPDLTPSNPSGETTEPGGLTSPSEPGGLTSPSTRPGSGTTSPNTPSSGSPDSGSSGSGTSPRGVAPKAELKQASTTDSSETTPDSQPSAAEAPTGTPADGTTPDASTAPESVDISDAELQQFANVIPKLQEIERSAQQQLSQAIEEAGITQQRFNELYSSEQRSPNTPAPAPDSAPQAATPATPEERESFNQVLAEIQTINQQVQTQKIDVLRSEGLQPQQFNRILAAVQQDPSLQQQVQQLLNN